jgi:hypothetical protein
VFAYHGANLVLLPVNSVEYQQSTQFTAKQSKKISAKELIKGATYSLKKDARKLIYIGYYECFDEKVVDADRSYNPLIYFDSVGKKHVFYDDGSYVTPSVSTLAECINDNPVGHYADLVDGFFKTKLSSKIVDIGIKSYDGEGTQLISGNGLPDLKAQLCSANYYINPFVLNISRQDNKFMFSFPSVQMYSYGVRKQCEDNIKSFHEEQQKIIKELGCFYSPAAKQKFKEVVEDHKPVVLYYVLENGNIVYR